MQRGNIFIIFVLEVYPSSGAFTYGEHFVIYLAVLEGDRWVGIVIVVLLFF